MVKKKYKNKISYFLPHLRICTNYFKYSTILNLSIKALNILEVNIV